MIIDSGACASVMLIDWCPHVDITSAPQSRAKEYFRAVNGNKVYNEGQKLVTMMTREGTKRDLKFTVCDVSKAIGSVSQLCRTGHRFIFNPPWDGNGSYIEHLDIGEKMRLEEKGYIYILPAEIAPKHKQTGSIQSMGRQWNEDFHWQARP